MTAGFFCLTAWLLATCSAQDAYYADEMTVHPGVRSRRMLLADLTSGLVTFTNYTEYAAADCEDPNATTVRGMWLNYFKASMGEQTVTLMVTPPDGETITTHLFTLGTVDSFQPHAACFAIDVCSDVVIQLDVYSSCKILGNACFLSSDFEVSYGLFENSNSQILTQDIANGTTQPNFGTCPSDSTNGIYPSTHRPLDVRISQPTSEFSPVFWLTDAEDQFIGQDNYALTTYLDIYPEDLEDSSWIEGGLWVDLGLTTFAEDATIVLCFNFDADPIPTAVSEGRYGPVDGDLAAECDFCWPTFDCSPSSLQGYWLAEGISIGTQEELLAAQPTGIYVTTFVQSIGTFSFATSDHTIAFAWGHEPSSASSLSVTTTLLVLLVSLLQ